MFPDQLPAIRSLVKDTGKTLSALHAADEIDVDDRILTVVGKLGKRKTIKDLLFWQRLSMRTGIDKRVALMTG